MHCISIGKGSVRRSVQISGYHSHCEMWAIFATPSTHTHTHTYCWFSADVDWQMLVGDVGGWPTPLKNMSQWEWLSHIYPIYYGKETCSKPPTQDGFVWNRASPTSIYRWDVPWNELWAHLLKWLTATVGETWYNWLYQWFNFDKNGQHPCMFDVWKDTSP